MTPKEVISYWRLKEEVLYRNLWRTRFGRAMNLSQDVVRDDDEHKRW